MIEEFFDTVGLTAGILIILGIGIVIFLIVAVIMEVRTRSLFPDRPKRPGEGGIFDFSDDDDDDDF